MAGQSISKGALTLTLDAATLQAGLSKVQSQISSFGSAITGILGAQLGFAGISGIVDQVKALGDESENMLNLAEVFEVNVEKMQALALAANLAGIETESLIKALRIASEKFPGNDPISSLFKALQQLQDIPNVQERIKQASEIFGGKNAVEVLKIMKANIPEVAKELEGSATLSERQLKAWDAMGDAVSLFFTKFKNEVKGFVADTIISLGPPEEKLKTIEQIVEEIAALRKDIERHTLGAIANDFDPASIERLNQLWARLNQLVAEYNKRLDAHRAAEDRRTQGVITMRHELEQLGRVQELERAGESIKQFEKPDAITEFTQAFNDLNFLFDERRRTVEEYTNAMKNLKKALEATAGAAEEVRLPGAALRGSVEDVSTTIRSSVGKDNNRSAEVVDLLDQINKKLGALETE